MDDDNRKVLLMAACMLLPPRPVPVPVPVPVLGALLEPSGPGDGE